MASFAKTVLERNLNGSVKWFDMEKGYGFIKKDNGGDLFVHNSEVDEGFLVNDERVLFDVAKGRKGNEAVNVRIVTASDERRQSDRELRSVFRQLARLRSLFGGEDDDEYEDEDDDYLYGSYFDSDDDDDDFLRYYDDSFYDDDEDDDDVDDDDDWDEDEEEERPDKYFGLAQMFAESLAKPAVLKAAPVQVVKPPITCTLCEEEAAPVTFYPCEHEVCCEDCSVRLRKCPLCKEAISKKEKPDGEQIEGAVKYSELLKIIQAQEDAQTCLICMEHKKNTVFGCGHLACQSCAKVLTSCHVCRQKIHHRTKVFEI